MNRFWLKCTGALALACLLALTSVPAGPVTVHATSVTKSDIEAAKNEKAAIEKKRAAAEADLKDLQQTQGSIEDYITKLDKKQADLESDISTLTKSIKKQRKKIAKTKKELAAAEETEESQYATMKERIKYMYENGSSDYVEILLGAKNISDLLNQSEYMADITEYDGKLLDSYNAAKLEVSEKKTEQEDQLSELATMKGELQVDKETNEKLLAVKQKQLQKYNVLVAEAGDKVSDLAAAEDAQDSAIDNLIAKAEAEEAARKEAERKAKEEAERKAREAAAREAAAREAAANANQNSNSDAAETPSASSSSLLSGGLIWPMPSSHLITSGFGNRAEVTANSGTYHSGVDIGVAAGTPIIAAAGGTVVEAGYHWSMGNYVLISHGGGIYTVYMHCSKLLVSSGQSVSQGQQIGLVGSTGVATGPHLHFGLKINGTYVNPLNYVN